MVAGTPYVDRGGDISAAARGTRRSPRVRAVHRAGAGRRPAAKPHRAGGLVQGAGRSRGAWRNSRGWVSSSGSKAAPEHLVCDSSQDLHGRRGPLAVPCGPFGIVPMARASALVTADCGEDDTSPGCPALPRSLGQPARARGTLQDRRLKETIRSMRLAAVTAAISPSGPRGSTHTCRGRPGASRSKHQTSLAAVESPVTSRNPPSRSAASTEAGVPRQQNRPARDSGAVERFGTVHALGSGRSTGPHGRWQGPVYRPGPCCTRRQSRSARSATIPATARNGHDERAPSRIPVPAAETSAATAPPR